MKKIILTILILLICIPAFAGVLTYTLYPVNYAVYVDGIRYSGNRPLMSYNSTTYLPMAEFAKMIGAKTQFDGQRVEITTNKYSTVITPLEVDPNRIAESCVEVYVAKDGKDVSQGSGVFYENNMIITNDHVIQSGNSYRIIYNDGTTSAATLLFDNPVYDMAVLKPIDKEVKPVKIGDSDEIQQGEPIFTITSPLERKNTITKGNVINKSMFNNVNIFIITASVNHGSSGGGVFNKYGELIGIVVGGSDFDTDIRGYVIPINDIRKAMTY